MIPKKYLDRKKRMKWAYIFGKDGKVREPYGTYTLATLIAEVFPNTVVPGFDIDLFNDKQWSRDFDDWCAANMKNGWTMWATEGNMRIPSYHFEVSADALLFKLKWS